MISREPIYLKPVAEQEITQVISAVLYLYIAHLVKSKQNSTCILHQLKG